MMILLIFLGGMLGAVTRFEISRRFNQQTFPFGTMLANFTGGLILGFVYRLHEVMLIDEWIWGLLGIGFCGAYTTYSTFSYEAVSFYKEGKWIKASLYIAGSIALTVAGVWMII